MALLNISAAILIGAFCALLTASSYVGGISEVVVGMFALSTAILAGASLAARKQRAQRARLFALISAASFVGLLSPIALRGSIGEIAFWLAGAVVVFSANLAAALFKRAPS